MPRKPGLIEALLPIVLLLIMLFFNIRLYGDNSVAGPNQMALLFAATLAGIIAYRLGVKWENIQSKIVSVIGDAMPSILILLLIGALAGTWMISGVVPTLVYYGLELLSPRYFLVISVVISALVSVSIGSSWSTIATVGVALFSIGTAMGFYEGLVAGAIISGAYFGDKMSPLSDTTNLAPAMAGTDLFTHIRYMAFTTVPSILITLIIFLVLGFTVVPVATAGSIEAMLLAIDQEFFLSPILLLVPVILILLIVKKVPPIPALFAGVLLGALFALLFQQDLLIKIQSSDIGIVEACFTSVMDSMYGTVEITTSNEQVNNLLSTGGMADMLDTIWLILTAMVFSGVMESAGMLIRIAESIVRMANSTGSLVASTVATSVFMNITASEQYISIVIPGRMFKEVYKRKGLKPEVLSRTLEDGGTVTSVLIPWNTCGAVQASVLGISTLVYAPFVFFSILSPIVTIAFAYFNIKIRRFETKENEDQKISI